MSAIDSLQAKVKVGPEFVCTSCHRMMYRLSVDQLNKDKCTKASDELLHKVFSAQHKYVHSDGKELVCKTCNGALNRGNMPLHHY